MLHTVLNKSWKQNPTKLRLHSHLLRISQTIHVSWAIHAGHCWGSKNEIISGVLLWTSTVGHTSVGRPAKTYMHLLSEDTGCHLEHSVRVMSDRDGLWKRIKRIPVVGTCWWWWCWSLRRGILSMYISLYVYIHWFISPVLLFFKWI